MKAINFLRETWQATAKTVGAIHIFLVLTIVIFAEAVHACGWWGDSEMSSRRQTALITPDGRAVEETLSLQSMKLPGEAGYGVAVPEPGRAIPYRLATNGQTVTRINEFRIFGFRSVIDLGTPTSTAHLHGIETETAGMAYFNIPIESNMPNRQQTRMFNQIVLNARNGPLLVYAPRAELLAVMWAFYRLSLGSPMAFVLSEAEAMGLTAVQEAELRDRTHN